MQSHLNPSNALQSGPEGRSHSFCAVSLGAGTDIEACNNPTSPVSLVLREQDADRRTGTAVGAGRDRQTHICCSCCSHCPALAIALLVLVRDDVPGCEAPAAVACCPPAPLPVVAPPPRSKSNVLGAEDVEVSGRVKLDQRRPGLAKPRTPMPRCREQRGGKKAGQHVETSNGEVSLELCTETKDEFILL